MELKCKHQENLQRMFKTLEYWIRLGGWSTKSMKDGKPSVNRMLTPYQVMAIRESKATTLELCKIFNASTTTITGIREGVYYTDF